MSGAYSAIILAGGDGTRLRPLTQALAGDDRPKQFCAVLGEDTLLDQTRRRARMSIDPARIPATITSPTTGRSCRTSSRRWRPSRRGRS